MCRKINVVRLSTTVTIVLYIYHIILYVHLTVHSIGVGISVRFPSIILSQHFKSFIILGNNKINPYIYNRTTYIPLTVSITQPISYNEMQVNIL